MIAPLLDRWLAEARVLRRRCCDEHADLIETLVEEAQAFLADQSRETVNLQRASELGGYSAAHLGRLIRQGKIPNAGRPGAPRIALKDLPRKRVAQDVSAPHIDRTQIVRLAINEE